MSTYSTYLLANWRLKSMETNTANSSFIWQWINIYEWFEIFKNGDPVSEKFKLSLSQPQKGKGSMKRQTISDGNIYLIAELGINHEGDIKVAETIIEQLGESGASAIKLQSFTPERYVSASDPVRLQRLKDFHWT